MAVDQGTRDRILDTALGLFRERGYAGTSIRDIAQRMGLTKAALYYHFPSKEDLLDAVLTPAMVRVGGLLEQAGELRTAEERRDFAVRLVDVVAEVGPQVVMILSDPAIGSHVRELAGGSSLPQLVGERLVGPLPEEPTAAAAARLRAACAVACLPAGVDAWRREHPGQSRLDEASRAVLVDAVLAVVESGT